MQHTNEPPQTVTSMIVINFLYHFKKQILWSSVVIIFQKTKSFPITFLSTEWQRILPENALKNHGTVSAYFSKQNFLVVATRGFDVLSQESCIAVY